MGDSQRSVRMRISIMSQTPSGESVKKRGPTAQK